MKDFSKANFFKDVRPGSLLHYQLTIHFRSLQQLWLIQSSIAKFTFNPNLGGLRCSFCGSGWGKINLPNF